MQFECILPDCTHASVSLSDEDECVVSPTACGDHAQCENTEGSYNCICNEGFKKSSVQTCEGTREDHYMYIYHAAQSLNSK